MKVVRAALTAAALVLGSAVVIAGPAFAQNTAYYIDCSAPTNGTGSQASPWNALSSANAKSGGFTAGDQILLKRSTTCQGTLSPAGSGAAGSPVTIGAYGTGSVPAIVAPAASDYAVRLSDQSYWTITNLDISGSSRYGVFVTVTSGVATGITLTNLTVHDVRGGQLDSKDTGLVVITPTHDATNSTSARFDQVLVDNVDAHGTSMWSGIIVGSGTNSDSWATTTSKRSTNVTVSNSTVSDVYGDGIVLFAVNNGLLDRNVAHDTGKQPTQTIGTPNAIWTWACNGCTVQRNEAYNNDSPGMDGGAFDVDYFSDNTVVQYNYGHDNSAYCVAVFGAGNYTTTNTVIRYNVCANNGTQNVGQRSELELLTWGGGSINGLAAYNNTFIAPHGAMRDGGTTFTGALPRTFQNNLIYSTSSNPFGSGSSLSSDYNLWYYTGGWWTNNEPHSVYANPQLVDPAHTGAGAPGAAYTLNASSPAVDAGVAISNSGSADFYGNPVPQSAGTDIGAAESAYASPKRELLSNGGFETGSTAGWNSGSVTTSTPHTGAYGALVTGSNAGIYRTLSGLAPNSTYVFTAWVKSDAGNQGYLYAKNYGGVEVRTGALTSTSYSPAVLTFTTGPAGSTAEIGLWRDGGSGTGNVEIDDASVRIAAPSARLGNGGFESGAFAPWTAWPSGGSVISSNTFAGAYAASLTGSSSGIFQTLSGLSPNTTYVVSAWVKVDAGNQGLLYAKSYGGQEVDSYQVTSTAYVPVSVLFATGPTNTSAEVGIWRPAGSGTGTLYLDQATLVSL